MIEKVPRWIWQSLGGAVLIICAFGYWWANPPTKAITAEQQTAAGKAMAKPVIIWSKWKEVPLSDEWTEWIDTPTKYDRISPPPKGKVEILYENGAYKELRGEGADGQQYRVIDIRGGGRFKLKGTPKTKAIVWKGDAEKKLPPPSAELSGPQDAPAKPQEDSPKKKWKYKNGPKMDDSIKRPQYIHAQNDVVI